MARGGVDPLGEATEAFRALGSYSVTLRSTGGGTDEVIRYYYRKPGLVRMEFVNPHRGAVLVYDPVKDEVLLRPFGFLKPLVLRLKPDSWLIRSSRGHTVDKSDIGTLLEEALRLARMGTVESSDGGRVGGRPALMVDVRGGRDPSGKDQGGEITGYVLWLDRESMLPLKADALGPDGALVESVLMDDLVADPDLPDGFFILD